MEKDARPVCRIAILGAESTGKTTLAESLARHFGTVWVPEYAREYMSKNPGDYSIDDIVSISKEQLRMENELAQKASRLLFTDTEFIIAKVWCEDVFGTCPRWIEEQVQLHRYDLYLLTANDLPWVPDPLRVNGHRRDFLFEWYKRELEKQRLPFEIISGKNDARLQQAITVTGKLLK